MIKQALADIDWKLAEYDAAEQTVVFPVSPRSIVFKKVGGKWQIQN